MRFSIHLPFVLSFSRNITILLVENLRFSQFYTPQSCLKPSQGDLAHKIWCKLEKLVGPRRVENDAPARPPNLTSSSASRDVHIDLLTPNVHRCMAVLRGPLFISLQQNQFNRFRNIAFTMRPVAASCDPDLWPPNPKSSSSFVIIFYLPWK